MLVSNMMDTTTISDGNEDAEYAADPLAVSPDLGKISLSRLVNSEKYRLEYRPCRCLIGNGSGYIQNCCDVLHDMPVLLHILLRCYGDPESNAIRYTAGTLSDGLYLCASGLPVKTVLPDLRREPLVLCGSGRAKRYRPRQRRVSGEVRFTFTVLQAESGGYEFRMETVSGFDACLNHDSGIVKTQQARSDLCVS